MGSKGVEVGEGEGLRAGLVGEHYEHEHEQEDLDVGEGEGLLALGVLILVYLLLVVDHHACTCLVVMLLDAGQCATGDHVHQAVGLPPLLVRQSASILSTFTQAILTLLYFTHSWI